MDSPKVDSTPNVQDMLSKATESLARELDALDVMSRRAIAQVVQAVTYDLKLGSHVAWLASKRAEILSALRQLEKHDRTMAKTPEQRFRLICAYLQTEASPTQLAVLASIIDRSAGAAHLAVIA